jgi:hypothetical protein
MADDRSLRDGEMCAAQVEEIDRAKERWRDRGVDAGNGKGK